jgi:anti-sigma-K factor RskA
MSETEHNRPDISGFALGELSEQELDEFERELANDTELALEAQELKELVARMEDVDADAWSLPEPPPLKLDPAVLAKPTSASSARDTGPQREGLFSRLFGGSGWSVQPALATVLLAVVFVGGLGAGVLLSGGGSEEGGEIVASRDVALQPVGDLDPQATGDAKLEQSGQKIRIRVNGLAANSDDDFYEAWLMDPEKGLVSIGSFKVGDDGMAEIDVPVPVNPDEFPVVDISLEPADGAPAHSGKSVLRADLS